MCSTRSRPLPQVSAPGGEFLRVPSPIKRKRKPGPRDRAFCFFAILCGPRLRSDNQALMAMYSLVRSQVQTRARPLTEADIRHGCRYPARAITAATFSSI